MRVLTFAVIVLSKPHRSKNTSKKPQSLPTNMCSFWPTLTIAIVYVMPHFMRDCVAPCGHTRPRVIPMTTKRILCAAISPPGLWSQAASSAAGRSGRRSPRRCRPTACGPSRATTRPPGRRTSSSMAGRGTPLLQGRIPPWHGWFLIGPPSRSPDG